MTTRYFVAFAIACVVHTSAILAEPLKSGLQPGDKLTSVFEPLNVTGPFAGEPHCLVCENGLNPVAMVFARELSDPLVKLLAKIDAATGQNRNVELGSFVVFLNDKESLNQQLKELAKKQKFQHIILSTFASTGPEGFRITPESDVTVVFYLEHDVKANHAFRKGELSEAGVEKIIRDLPKIVGDKPQGK